MPRRPVARTKASQARRVESRSSSTFRPPNSTNGRRLPTLTSWLIATTCMPAPVGRSPDSLAADSSNPRPCPPKGNGRRRPTRKAATARHGEGSMGAVVHPQQALLRGELLALHLPERHVVERQHAELRVHDLLVQFLVPVVELPELGAGLHHRFEFRLRLSFEHGNLLRFQRCVARPDGPGSAGGGRWGPAGNGRPRMARAAGTVGGKMECPETTTPRLAAARGVTDLRFGTGPADPLRPVAPPRSRCAATTSGLSNGSGIGRSPARWRCVDSNHLGTRHYASLPGVASAIC